VQKHFFILFFIFVSVGLSCAEKKKNGKQAKDQEEVKKAEQQYNFQKPTKSWNLPKELNEISGIGLLNDSILLCNEDENGVLYFFNLPSATIEKEIKFGKKGDYEDLAIVGDTIFILRSDGGIFKIADLTKKAEEFNTGLHEHNNTEGLCYDASTSTLLITCKDDQGDLLAGKNQKIVYQISMPIGSNSVAQLISFDAKDCKPSAVAVHPISKNIFILSANAQKIIEINRQGEVLMSQDLDATIFAQPEGICFAKDGTMYISNEAAGGVANVLMFAMQ
jgi:SdiA-regulated